MKDHKQTPSNTPAASKDTNDSANVPAVKAHQPQIEEIGDTSATDEQQNASSSTSTSTAATKTKKSKKDSAKTINKEQIAELLTGLALGKNKKDVADHAFWSTQPVPQYTEKIKSDGDIEGPKQVPQETTPLLDEFEWVTLDIEESIEEIYTLLSLNYVEDAAATFRFQYTADFLRWALCAPGWRPLWHVGVRVKSNKKLVAFISAIPVDLRIRDRQQKMVEINFLCVHKKLRQKRLAPVLIKEVTRRVHLENLWHALYTVGVVLPKPVSSCRYYHRSINWEKLYEVGFSPLPEGSTKQRQILKYKLPDTTKLKYRPMEMKDIDGVKDLLQVYLAKFEMAPVFTSEEIEHWFLKKGSGPVGPVVWSYVIEEQGEITDLVSFYALPSTIIGNTKHKLLNAAYLFYYASKSAIKPQTHASATDDTTNVDEGAKDVKSKKKKDKDKKREKNEVKEREEVYKNRLETLISDALILAKEAKFDVFNALTLMDNPYFLDNLKFGAGDGFLHFYLYNYRAVPISGGLTDKNELDTKNTSGIGVVML